MPKPSDFFLSVVSFLGILVPGAVLVFLHGTEIASAAGLSLPNQDATAKWIAATLAAYIAGQILLAVTEPLNNWAGRAAGSLPGDFPKALKLERKDYKPAAKFLQEWENDRFRFHEAISRVQLRNPGAAADINRHMADYKLLRNLVPVFLFDLIYACWPLANGPRIAFSAILSASCFYGFVRMHAWAELLALQYVRLSEPAETKIQDAADILLP
jgi:hypothetical protein